MDFYFNFDTGNCCIANSTEILSSWSSYRSLEPRLSSYFFALLFAEEPERIEELRGRRRGGGEENKEWDSCERGLELHEPSVARTDKTSLSSTCPQHTL